MESDTQWPFRWKLASIGCGQVMKSMDGAQRRNAEGSGRRRSRFAPSSQQGRLYAFGSMREYDGTPYIYMYLCCRRFLRQERRCDVDKNKARRKTACCHAVEQQQHHD